MMVDWDIHSDDHLGRKGKSMLNYQDTETSKPTKEQFLKDAFWFQQRSRLFRRCFYSGEIILPMQNAVRGYNKYIDGVDLDSDYNSQSWIVNSTEWISTKSYIMLKLQGKVRQ